MAREPKNMGITLFIEGKIFSFSLFSLKPEISKIHNAPIIIKLINEGLFNSVDKVKNRME
jgi:hypothetical protein